MNLSLLLSATLNLFKVNVVSDIVESIKDFLTLGGFSEKQSHIKSGTDKDLLEILSYCFVP